MIREFGSVIDLIYSQTLNEYDIVYKLILYIIRLI